MKIVIGSETGIVTGLDTQEIADALEELVNSADLRAKMGAAATKFTLANFGLQRLVNDHENLYKKYARLKNNHGI